MLHELIILITLVEERKSRNYFLSSFLHFPHTSFPFDPNILPSTLFSNTRRLCSSLNVKTMFHIHRDPQAKLQAYMF
jgi:hypothetical protein